MPVDEVEIGDRLVVLSGDVLPVDGTVVDGHAVVDESSLTGEPLPATIAPGEPVRSGTVNAGAAFELRAVRPAAESAYAALVRLVRQAETERAPFVRLADRYAAFFLPRPRSSRLRRGLPAASPCGRWPSSSSPHPAR